MICKSYDGVELFRRKFHVECSRVDHKEYGVFDNASDSLKCKFRLSFGVYRLENLNFPGVE